MKFTVLLAVFVAAVQAAPVIRSASQPIPNQYIVILKEGTSVEGVVPKFNEIARRRNAPGRLAPAITRKFSKVSAFTVTADDAAVQELSSLPEVEYIEQDTVVQAYATQISPPSWGLIRIAQHDLDLTVNAYPYPDVAGDGVTAFVLDTGIFVDHDDFGGRAVHGFNAISGSPDTDENGHGTHIAATIGGEKYGAAKKVKLVSVKVLDAAGSGTASGVIAGLDYVISNAIPGKSLVNMSLGGAYSAAINSFVQRVYKSNIPIIAAGGSNPCNSSPAGAPNVYTVASSDPKDRVSATSPLAPCVEIFAPGVKITSAWIGSPTASQTISGSSTSAAHVSGALALYLSQYYLPTAQAAYDKLTATASLNKLTGNLGGAPNHLVYTLG
ncbi:hypothetical protein BGW41_000209 [Actinomortierella wolfii]|nr:hypothetical protein BGW41_000209 [Actinomortierella wolfii]